MSRSDVGTACPVEPFVFGSHGRRELALLILSQEGPAVFVDYLVRIVFRHALLQPRLNQHWQIFHISVPLGIIL